MISIKKICTFLCLLAAFATQLHGYDCRGKAEIAPAYAHIDVLESGKTVHQINLAAVKADASIMLWQGLCLKPNLLYGTGNATLVTTGLGLGYIFPVQDNLCITPSVGVNYTFVKTQITYKNTFFGEIILKEKFQSVSPYIGIEAAYTFCPSWRICAFIQYAWSSTWTHIKGMDPSSRGHSDGANYGLMIEHDLNNQWSINVGGAYNESLSKEKHGLRGAGVKLGLARWF